ncbi:hypothetical protein LIT38_13070 [Bacillus sp. CMF12]|uniref:hypothetical protein n=1 Tax=Bacillaceae TaxID=186817 RepID=UPI001FB42F04|nr:MULTISPECIES: hypothetical protein [Bacillaceae]UOE53107.1 hypothetical protein IRB79_14360 [Cytobacillus oceanisediminis]USK52316.1 hypothetical protein LIT38_13070 [Bacillus sp. CMF12]
MKTFKPEKRRQKRKRAEGILNLNYNVIGSGSHRIVYDLQNGYVLKIPLRERGFKSNKAEYNLFLNCPPELQKHLCPVVELGQGWMIMKKMDEKLPRNAEYEEKISNLGNLFLSYGINPLDLKRKNLMLAKDGKITVIDYGNFRMIMENSD